MNKVGIIVQYMTENLILL